MSQVKQQKNFEDLLAQAVDSTMKYCLGEINANIISDYLQKQNLPLSEISNNPELFSEELRNMLGFGGGQILGAASVLEETILEVLCRSLGAKRYFTRPVNFPLELRKLKEEYNNGGSWR
jgi:hypothetical protein